MIEFKNVSYRYDEEGPWVLDDVSFQISASEWVAIIGHNGSGKSTIAKLINGLILPHQGQIIVNSIPVNEDTIWDVRRTVGMVFQNPENQFVGTTVRDDVAFGLENRGIPREEMIKRIDESLATVAMKDYMMHEPHRLSGGQKQRVAIAGVLAISPETMILDEATAMLDPKGRNEIMTTIHNLRQQGNISLVSITHDLNEVTHADKVIVLNQGKIWMETSPREVFAKRDRLLEIGLDTPFIAQLASELSSQGVNISKQPLNHEELLEELWTLHSTM